MYTHNTQNLKIRTPYGWESFSGILYDNITKPGVIVTTKNTKITVGTYHLIKTNDHTFKQAKDLSLESIIQTKYGFEQITSLELTTLFGSYEIINTETHEVMVNGVCNHQCDEFAFVKNNIQEKFWTSISPTLSTGGSCLIASTPNGDSNKFADIWFTALAAEKENSITEEDFVPMQIDWNEVPGRGEEFKQAIIKKEGLTHWLQEYECDFISSDNLLIDTNKLKLLNAQVDAPFFTSKKHKIQFWDKFRPNKQFIVGIDPATGNGKDFSVISIFEFPSLMQVALYRSNTLSSAEIYVILTDLLKAIEAAGGISFVSVENNGVGEGIISLYQIDEYFPESAKFINETDKKLGFTTSVKSKWMSCLVLKDMLENDDITILSPMMLKELKTYVRKGTSYCAQAGGTDDCVSSLLIVIRILERMTKFDPLAHNKFYTERHNRATNTVSLTRSDINGAFGN